MKKLKATVVLLFAFIQLEAQSREFETLLRVNRTVVELSMEQQMRLFENGTMVESLVSRTTYYQNAHCYSALPIEVYTGSTFKVVLDHESKRAFILPVEDSLPLGRRFDSLMVKEMIDSVGQQNVADSQQFYLDVFFVSTHPYRSIRFFYDDTYRITGYNLHYNPVFLPAHLSNKRLECRITYKNPDVPVFDWSSVVIDTNGIISLANPYKNFEVINLLTY